MSKCYLVLNLFLSLINYGFLYDSNDLNQTVLSSFKHSPMENEFLQNKIISQKNITEESKLCSLIKNSQLRLSNKIETNRMPLFRSKLQKPYENSNINLSKININNPQVRPLRCVNNNDNIDSEHSLKTAKFERPSTLSVESSRINTLDEKLHTSSSTENNVTVTVLKTNSSLLPSVSLRNNCQDAYSPDKGNKTDINTKSLDSQTVYENLENNVKSDVDKQGDSIIREDNIEENRNDDTCSTQESTQEDVSLSLDLNEFNRLYDSENVKRENQRRSNKIVYSDKQSDNNESDSEESESIDYSSLNLNDINQQPLQSKSGTMLPKLEDTNPLLIESPRICYACSSANDVSCLKPNRHTTVKYCHKDNEACVVKRYRIGSPNYLIRDCASSCKRSDISGVILKYESCSICHSNLCNSAYSISMSIIPCFSLFAVITVFY